MQWYRIAKGKDAMIKPKIEEPRPDEDHPKPKPRISRHTLIYQACVVVLLTLIAILQLIQLSTLRSLPGVGALDANGPIAVDVVNRELRVQVENSSGELGTHPLTVEISPNAAPVKVEIAQPQPTIPAIQPAH